MNNPNYKPKITASFGIQETYIEVPEELMIPFKQLINKALNTYPDAHPALKEFGDLLTHGKVLQDYYSQRTDKQLIAPSDC